MTCKEDHKESEIFELQFYFKPLILLLFSLQGAVTNPDPIVRCAAGEALGRIAQAVGSPVFTSNLTQKIFDQLKAARDTVSRTGYSVALGCIHRYVGGMASGHHLNSSVSILLALSKDNSSSLVQVMVCCVIPHYHSVSHTQ